MKQAFLYRRFSDLAQSKGSSLARQDKLAKEWCKRNSAEIIDVKTDKGVSAFKGKHAAIGALSEIINSIHSGEIPSGSYLLIENIDRLGRDDIAVAQARLVDILNAGINVVTLQDEKTYTKESLSDLGDLMILLVNMYRANEESATKSSRAHRTWEIKKDLIKNGKTPKFKSPVWLTYNDSKKTYEKNEKAETVKLLFEIYLDNLSINRTAKELNAKGIPTLRHAKSWLGSTVRFIIESKSTYGYLDLPDIQQEDFYPAVVPKETFYKAQSIKSRNNEKRKSPKFKSGETSNLLTGIAECSVCGSSLYLHGKERLTAAGHVENYKYLSCSTNRNNKEGHKCSLPNFRYKHVEVLIAYISTKFDTLPNKDNKETKGYLVALIDSLKKQLEDAERREMNVANILSDTPSEALKQKLREHIDEQVTIKGKIESTQIQLTNLDLPNDITTKEKLQGVLNKLGDDNFRRQFVSMLDRTVDNCTFNENGSINMTVLGNDIYINKIRGRVNIKFPNSDAYVNIA